MRIVCAFIELYLLVFFANAVLSWIPGGGTAVTQIRQFLRDVTEPVIAPVRRVVPPAGMFDISYLIVSFGLVILQQAVCGA